MFTNVLSVPGDALEIMNRGSNIAGYNRCYDEQQFSKIMSEIYEDMFVGADKATEKRVRKNTKNSWRLAFIPIVPILVHKHKFGKSCEEHMRVMLGGNPKYCLDLIMDHYDLIVEKNQK
jgi:hypothetical protein